MRAARAAQSISKSIVDRRREHCVPAGFGAVGEFGQPAACSLGQTFSGQLCGQAEDAGFRVLICTHKIDRGTNI